MDEVSAGKIGKYQIIKILGRGGMGEVLLAQDEDLGRRVAIKRPFRSAQGDGLARFQVEAKAATLRHPNIPAVYEMGMEDGLPFIAMEFVEGETLDKLIAAGNQLDLITKLGIMEQVCSALSYAHENGIIHRDIKPANVIVQPDGVAKIIDFGIAKIQGEDSKAGLTQTSAVIGSLLYIAPERFKGGPIDGRVDIFSAGVTLFKLLTGEEPFTGGETTASYKIVNEAHSALSAYLQDYPPVLDEIIAKSLAKNPEDRYLSGEDFADDLHEVIESLKRNRILTLFNDAERLTTEKRFVPALELLDEAIKLDPANTQVRKLRKFVREHRERIRRAEQLRACIIRAEQALSSGNYGAALAQLKDAQSLDPSSEDIKSRIQSLEEKKRRSEMSMKALADAEASKSRGDITGALSIVTKALQNDPENNKLLALSGYLTKHIESEAQRAILLELLENARMELAANRLAATEKLLGEANGIDSTDLEVDKLCRELAKAKELELRRNALNEIQIRVSEFLRSESYDQATELLNRAIEKLPNEAILHRLTAEVDAEVRKSEAKHFVDVTIAQARDLFAVSPLEALAVLQKALDERPDEERLLAYEQSLRQQLDSLRVEKLQADTLLRVREMMAEKQFDKAVAVLESFLFEFGHHTDVDDLLVFARDELASLRHKAIVDRCIVEGRNCIRDGRLDEAIQLLDTGARETGDASLSRLLEEVREQQVALARKIELLQKRITLLRDGGALDEAIQLLQQQLAATPGNTALQELLANLLAEQEIKQVTNKAIAGARDAIQKKEFSAGLESLQAVFRAYGESTELTGAVKEVETARASYAQEVVGKSIISARAALLEKNLQGALSALKEAAQLIEFADPKKQTDWQRIGESVKKALEQSGTAAPGGEFEQKLSEIAAARSRSKPIWIILFACVALAATAIFVMWRMRPLPPPSVAHIKIAKAPPGALVTIDNGPPSQANARGELTVQVQPGLHQLQVSQEGFESFTDKLEVSSGETVQDDVSLTKLLPSGASGMLSPSGNVAEFKLGIDGRNLGLHRVGGAIALGVGIHKVKYSALDDSDSQEHTVQIVANQTTPDGFFLKSVTPKPQATDMARGTGNLIIQTSPGAQVSVDGHRMGAANVSGSYTVQGLSRGQHSIDISLDNFQSASRQISITAGQTQTLSMQLQAVVNAAPAHPTGYLSVSTNSIERGQSVTLTWQVNNASSVSISELGAVAPQGSRTVNPEKSTKFELVVNGSTPLAEQYVDVRELKPQAMAANISTSAQSAGPNRASLEPAIIAYKNLIAKAPGKNSKNCKTVLTGAYQGKLQALARWCDSAKGFEVSEQCTQVGGSPDAPTLTCSESLAINPKDGDTQVVNSQKTFRFTKNSEGNWQISGW